MNISFGDYWGLLAKYLKTQRKKMALLTALLVGSLSIQLINPQIMRFFIDTAISGDEGGSLPAVALLFLGAALVNQLLTVGVSYLSADIGWASTNLLRRDLARHCLTLDMAFHNEHTPGEFIERVDGDVSTLANFFSQFTLQIVANLILLTGVLALLFREAWQVGLTMTLFAGLMFVALGKLGNIAGPYWRAVRQISAEFYGFLEERLAGTEDIRANGATAYILRRFHELARQFFHRELKAQLVTNGSIASGLILVNIGNAAALLVSGLLFEGNVLTIGTVYLLFHYSNMLVSPIRRISRQIEDFQKAGAGIARVQEFMAVRPQITDSTRDATRRSQSEQPLPDGALAATFQNVSFAYHDQQPVLDGFSLRLEAGTVLGLLGRTGSGKTTLSRLLMRFYEPQAGQVTVGGVEIRQTRLADLRQRVGMVTQNVQLFHASVRDNLTFFDPTVPDEQIMTTLQALRLTDWLNSLPAGLDSRLESGGSWLSTGEAQLLALARVFLRDPGLIILDEASARLDPATEQKLESAIDRLLHGRTAIIIAHRLTTIQRADEILILEDGHIREHGPRIELAANPTSHFHHLLQVGLDDVLA